MRGARAVHRNTGNSRIIRLELHTQERLFSQAVAIHIRPRLPSFFYLENCIYMYTMQARVISLSLFPIFNTTRYFEASFSRGYSSFFLCIHGYKCFDALSMIVIPKKKCRLFFLVARISFTHSTTGRIIIIQVLWYLYTYTSKTQARWYVR